MQNIGNQPVRSHIAQPASDGQTPPAAVSQPKPLILRQGATCSGHLPPEPLSAPGTPSIRGFVSGADKRAQLALRVSRLKQELNRASEPPAQPAKVIAALANRAVEATAELARHADTPQPERLRLLEECVDMHLGAHGQSVGISDRRMAAICEELADAYLEQATGKLDSFGDGVLKRPDQLQPLSYAKSLKYHELSNRFSFWGAIPHPGIRPSNVEKFATAAAGGIVVQLDPDHLSANDLELLRIASQRPEELHLQSKPLIAAIAAAHDGVIDALFRRQMRDAGGIASEYLSGAGKPFDKPEVETEYSASPPDPANDSTTYKASHTWPDGTTSESSYTHEGPGYHQQVFDFKHADGSKFRHIHQFNLLPPA